MPNELIVFTHCDLDALGCMLNIEYRFPAIPKKYFHTNYANIDEKVSEILEYAQGSNTSHLVIPDVSFSDNRASLERLYNTFTNVTHIDHHMYPDGFWDEFPNTKVVWDKSKSATKLCNEYLGNAGKNERLDKLTRIIDVYDIWQKNEPEFAVSQDLNEFFWTYDIGLLCQEIVQNDFKLPPTYPEVVQNIKAKYAADIASYEERKLIHRAGEITIAFIDDWFNQVMLKEHASGKNFVIGANSYGIIRIRINQDCPYTEAQLNKVRFRLTGNAEYGHLHAFTYKVQGTVDFNKLMAEVQKIVSIIDEECN